MSCAIFSGAAVTVLRSRMALAWRPCANASAAGRRAAVVRRRSMAIADEVPGLFVFRVWQPSSGAPCSAFPSPIDSLLRSLVCLALAARGAWRSPLTVAHGLLFGGPLLPGRHTAQSQASCERRAVCGALGAAGASGLPEEGRQRQLPGDALSVLPVHRAAVDRGGAQGGAQVRHRPRQGAWHLRPRTVRRRGAELLAHGLGQGHPRVLRGAAQVEADLPRDRLQAD